MKTCFLMGKRDAPDSIEEKLLEQLERLVSMESVTELIVGHRGSFDRIATSAVQRICRRWPEVYAYRLVCYHDAADTVPIPELFEDLYYPLELYRVPERYAIAKANQIVLKQSDFLITYALSDGGNTGEIVRMAKRMEKAGQIRVINLAQL